MTYRIIGEKVLRGILDLPDADEIWADLAHLEFDPENSRGDLTSPIREFKDLERPYHYTILVGRGHIITYKVAQDHPVVILKSMTLNPAAYED